MEDRPNFSLLGRFVTRRGDPRTIRVYQNPCAALLPAPGCCGRVSTASVLFSSTVPYFGETLFSDNLSWLNFGIYTTYTMYTSWK